MFGQMVVAIVSGCADGEVMEERMVQLVNREEQGCVLMLECDCRRCHRLEKNFDEQVGARLLGRSERSF